MIPACKPATARLRPRPGGGRLQDHPTLTWMELLPLLGATLARIPSTRRRLTATGGARLAPVSDTNCDAAEYGHVLIQWMTKPPVRENLALGLETHARSCARQAEQKSDEQELRKNDPGDVSTNVVVVTQGVLYQIPAQVPDQKFYHPLADLYRVRNHFIQLLLNHGQVGVA